MSILVEFEPLGKMLILVLAVLGGFLAKVCPKTPFNTSGSENGAERAQNQLRRPILSCFVTIFW
jgi:hypothetical protein